MAELPEISKIAKQMKLELKNKKIKDLTFLQEKNLNIPINKFQKRAIGSKINDVQNKGKWIHIFLDSNENILISLGMGGDLLYFKNKETEKYQVKIDFDDNSGFTIRFWWFGNVFLLTDNELTTNDRLKNIAIDPFNEEFTYEYFRKLFFKKKRQIKGFLIDQKQISGIGNMYIHDILFSARLHPQKKISNMEEEEFKILYDSIISILRSSKNKGAFNGEMDFYGNYGDYSLDDFLIAYKEDQPCPICGSTIEKIKTGSTSSFICPKCQKI